VSAASLGLGKTAYEAAFQRGRAMTTEERVAFAAEDKQPPKAAPAAKPGSHALPTHRQLDVAGLSRMASPISRSQSGCSCPNAPSKPTSPNSLNKLGLNSRTQISRWMADLSEPGLTAAEERP
jgi:hypothetical protein